MPPAGEKRSFAQDFFFELMRDSQRVRAVYLAERERWIRSLEISGREEILFELEMLLRGIDRFFNLRNLFGEVQPPQERDWKEELKATRDAVHRGVHLSRKLIEQRQEQALLFRNFVEGSLADDRARSRLGAELREQPAPVGDIATRRGYFEAIVDRGKVRGVRAASGVARHTDALGIHFLAADQII